MEKLIIMKDLYFFVIKNINKTIGPNLGLFDLFWIFISIFVSLKPFYGGILRGSDYKNQKNKYFSCIYIFF